MFVVAKTMTAGEVNQLISVQPDEIKFIFESERHSYCDLKIVNRTEHYVAFKVKTTSPKKYFVRPNIGVIQPWDSCFIRVTLQAPRERSLDMQCKDKFLFQSTIVPQHNDVDELPQDTFNKNSGKKIEECKLKVSYSSRSSPQRSFESGVTNGNVHVSEPISSIQRLEEERDAATKKTQQLQRELDMLKRRRNEKSDEGFSIKVAVLVVLMGLVIGYMLNLTSDWSPQLAQIFNIIYDLNK